MMFSICSDPTTPRIRTGLKKSGDVHWKHGVQTLIDPVPLVSPEEVPPPTELASKLQAVRGMLAGLSPMCGCISYLPIKQAIVSGDVCRNPLTGIRGLPRCPVSGEGGFPRRPAIIFIQR